MKRGEKMKNNIEKFRKELNLSQEQLAEKANISRMTISNIESGKQKIIRSITMEKLAKALGKKIYEVFF